MGVVQRQSAKYSIVSYLAVGIGMINVLLIYPLCFAKEEIGLIRTLIDAAGFAVPFVYLGVNALVIRFYAEFKDTENGHNGFLGLIFLIASIGFLIFLALYLPFHDNILDLISNDSPLLREYVLFVPPLVFLIACTNILTSYSNNFYRIAIPGLLNHSIKFILPIAGLLYYFGYINFEATVYSVILNWLLIALILFFYIYQLGELKLRINFSFLNQDRIKRMSVYGFYGILGSLGTVLATKIDTLMISSLSTLDSTGIYYIAFVISNAVDIPRTALRKITAPLVVKAWHENNTSEVAKLYRKSSLNLLIIELYLFIGVWACIDDLYKIMPNGEEFEPGKYVVFILGITRLLDAVTSINDNIIAYSKFFRFNFYAILVMAVINVICNWFFIPIWTINGAALATLVSIGLYNALKLGFIQRKFKMLPFTKETLKVIGLGILTYSFVYFLPALENPFMNIFLKGTIISLIYLGSTYWLKLSPELNEYAISILRRLIRKS